MIKICGLTSVADAHFCAGAGADLLGFIFHEPSPRNADPDEVARVNASGATKVGVFVSQTPDQVLEIMDRAKLDMAQLHGGQDQAFCKKVGPDRVIRVLWPEKYESTADLQKDLDCYIHCSRYFLLDAGTSGGGHGRPFDSDVTSKVKIPLPWFLAGGVNPDNMNNALKIGADGIDISSGVEALPGVKDREKVRRVMEIITAHAERI